MNTQFYIRVVNCLCTLVVGACLVATPGSAFASSTVSTASTTLVTADQLGMRAALSDISSVASRHDAATSLLSEPNCSAQSIPLPTRGLAPLLASHISLTEGGAYALD